MGDTNPWIVIGPAIVSAAAVLVATAVAHRFQRHREDEQWRRDQKAEAYANVIGHVGRYRHAVTACRVRSDLAYRGESIRDSIHQAAEGLADVYSDCRSAMSISGLLGSSEFECAADDLLRLYENWLPTSGPPQIVPPLTGNDVESEERLQRRLQEVARRDLGVEP